MYLIPIKVRVPLIFAPLISAPLIFVHPQILRPFNFRAPLFYCKFAVFSFIRGIFSSPFNFRAFALRELAPFNFRAGQMRENQRGSNFNGNKVTQFNAHYLVDKPISSLLVQFITEFYLVRYQLVTIILDQTLPSKKHPHQT